MRFLRNIVSKGDGSTTADKLGDDLRREVRRNVVAAANAERHMDRVATNMATIFDDMKQAVQPPESGER